MSSRLALACVLLASILAGCGSVPRGKALRVSSPAWEPGWSTPSYGHLAGDDEADEDGETTSGFEIVYGVLLYIPNRILDALDIVRARVRLGPGLAVGARASEYADAYIGTYMTVYVGLPGPRGRKLPRLPFGLESRTGVEASVADLTVEGPLGPDYGELECGVSFQLLLLGVDVGIGPWETIDFIVGLATLDPMDDDF